MRISDWSSDVCSSDLQGYPGLALWLLLHGVGIVQLERLRRRYRKTRRAEEQWIAPLATALQQIGRASCRERVCQYVSISVVAVSLKKKQVCKIKRLRITATHNSDRSEITATNK